MTMDHKRLSELIDKLVEPGLRWTSIDRDELLEGIKGDYVAVVFFCDRLESWLREHLQTRERCESVSATVTAVWKQEQNGTGD